MTREEYMSVLLSKGFAFEKTTLSYPGWRGDEDIYTKKPEYKYTFRVFRMFKDNPDYGMYAGVGDQYRSLDALAGHNIDLQGSSGLLPLWTNESFTELMEHF